MWGFPQTEEINSQDHGPCICGKCHDTIPGNFGFQVSEEVARGQGKIKGL